MSVIINDPPDPNWQTIASAPPTHPGSLPKVPGLSKRGQQAFASYVGATERAWQVLQEPAQQTMGAAGAL